VCLLVVASPNCTPQRKDLENASCNNPHGFGYAIIAGDKIITGKGMSSRKVINEFLEVRKQHPGGYAMFHARYATHGVKNEQNCHPFMVGGREDTYLAHNGVLDIKINNGDKRSDTRVFAEDMLPKIGGVSSLDDDNILKMVEKWSSGSKLAIFTLDPSAKYDCYIINEDAGHWDNAGMWWSNSTYKADYGWASYFKKEDKHSTKSIGGWTNLNDYDDNEVVDEAECGMCGAFQVEDANPWYCEYCFACYDCNGTYGDSCMCYNPEYDAYAKSKREGRQYVFPY
jgi:glutamine amidotransferase